MTNLQMLNKLIASLQNFFISAIKLLTLALLFLIVINVLMPVLHLTQTLSFLKLNSMSDLRLAIIPAIYYIIK